MRKNKIREKILDESLVQSEQTSINLGSWSLKIFIICSFLFLGFIVFYCYLSINPEVPEPASAWSPLPPSDAAEYLSWSGRHQINIFVLPAVFMLLLTWIIALIRISREPFSERKTFLIIIGSVIVFLGLVLFLTAI